MQHSSPSTNKVDTEFILIQKHAYGIAPKTLSYNKKYNFFDCYQFTLGRCSVYIYRMLKENKPHHRYADEIFLFLHISRATFSSNRQGRKT